MASQQSTLLVDTNVWLDYYLPNRPGHAEALSFILFAYEHGYPLLYPAAIVKDVFYLTANAFKRDMRNETGTLTERDAAAASAGAWGCVLHLREQATAVGADESDLWMACKLRSVHNDLEDNLIVAAAERASATYLITNDEALIKHSPVAALTPSDALALLQAKMA
ncbi:type II toxin-antitoxin system VapC family toxin [Arabiibacter massiliensis]|uniref:type II toxin-antitoxin system VapC family toxin n=1 Tax=Arabiibacter massiliensis TaxID=1870985 RepID=UPI0009B981D2|nr:type II toxin-antitoxin system VapC family toxin [Arabiibacter massiliensis]